MKKLKVRVSIVPVCLGICSAFLFAGQFYAQEPDSVEPVHRARQLAEKHGLDERELIAAAQRICSPLPSNNHALQDLASPTSTRADSGSASESNSGSAFMSGGVGSM